MPLALLPLLLTHGFLSPSFRLEEASLKKQVLRPPGVEMKRQMLSEIKCI
jgi:hypothetical protein